MDAFRGKDDLSDVPDEARSAVENMKIEKQQRLDDANSAWMQDPTELDFSPLFESLSNVVRRTRFKDKSKLGAKQQKSIDQLVEIVLDWSSDTTYHTPAGLDALKQKIGELEVHPDHSRALSAKTELYNKVKGLIVDQVPRYARAMEDYEKATKLEKQIEKTFSLSRNAADEGIIKKFMSSMRNNADTNYGKRLELARTVDKNLPFGSPKLTTRLAGETLGTWVPRGLTSNVLAGANLASPSFSNLALIPQVPYFSGAGAYGLGVGSRLGRNLANATGLSPSRARNISRLAFQSGRSKGLLDEQ